MNYLKEKVLDISHNHYNYLMNLENVNGVGFGFKMINGIWTKEPCIHVLVEEKLDTKYLTKNNIIPKTYMGIKTDVIKTGKVTLLSEMNSSLRLRPLESGCAISSRYFKEGNFHVKTGTLGCIVTRRKNIFQKDYFILSNNHVLADLNDAPIGTPIFQPKYGSGIEEEVAHLSEFRRIKFIGLAGEPVNLVDAAIAEITNKSLISNKIFGIGKIKGTAKPDLWLNVKKVGMKTGLTTGKIVTMGLTETFQLGNNLRAKFQDAIVTSIHSEKGDSGSCILNENNEIVGMAFAAGKITTTMNDINIILDELNVKLYTGK